MILLALTLLAAPQLVFQSSFINSPHAFVLARDGKTAVASNPYETSRVWDLETFQLVRILREGETFDLELPVAKGKLFDLAAAGPGKLAHRPHDNPGAAWASLEVGEHQRLQIDPPGQRLLLSGKDSLTVVEAQGPTVLARAKSPLTGEQSWGFGAGGTLVLGATLEEIVVLDAKTLALKKRFAAPRRLARLPDAPDVPPAPAQVPPVQLGRAAFVWIHEQVVHIDAETLAATPPVALRNAKVIRGDGNIAVRSLEELYIYDDEMLTALDAWTGAELFKFGGTTSFPPDVHFDPQGRLIWASPGAMNGTDLLKGSASRVFDVGGARELFSGAIAIGQISADGRWLVQGGYHEQLSFRSLQTGAVQRVPEDAKLHKIPSESRWNGVWTRDGRLVAFNVLGTSIGVWDTEKAAQVLWLEGTEQAEFTSPLLSPDGTLLAVVTKPKGDYSDGHYRIIELASGKIISQGEAVPLAFSRDGTQVAIANQHGALTGAVADVRTGAALPRLFAKAFVDDFGDPVALANRFDVEAWSQTAGSPHARSRRQLARSPDGRTIALASLVGRVALLDATTGKPRAEIDAHEVGVNALRFSPDSKRLLTFGLDRVTRLWDTASGELIATFAATARNPVTVPELVTYTPEGYYFGQRAAVQKISVRSGLRSMPIGQFDAWLNRPDIVLERLGGPSPAADYYRLSRERRLQKQGLAGAVLPPLELPSVRVRRDRIGAVVKQRHLTLQVEPEAHGAPIAGVQIYANGVPVFGPKGAPIALENGVATVELDLARGRNKLEVTALDELGRESVADVVLVDHAAPPQKPDLYLLSVGVSQYAQPDYKLLYAAKDAQDLLEAFAQSKPVTSTHAKIHTKAILDGAATRENILQAREFLAQAKVDDRVIVFFAGHGLLDAKAGYFFATADLDFADPAGRGLGFDQMASLLSGLTARHRLMFIDTCAAGEADEDEVARKSGATLAPLVQVASRGVKLKTAAQAPSASQQLLLTRELFAGLRRGSGASVIGSSSGVEFAFESAEIKNGVFTSALLETLEGDLGDQEREDVNLYDDMYPAAIEAAVRVKVEARTGGLQHPVAREINLDDPFVVWLQPERKTWKNHHPAPRKAKKKKKAAKG